MSKDKIEVNMNVYDIPILVEALEEANKEIERLNKKIEQYENLYCLKHKQFKEYKQYKDLLNILKGEDNE